MPRSFSYSKRSSCSNFWEGSPLETLPIFSSSSMSSFITVALPRRSCCRCRYHHLPPRTSFHPTARGVPWSAPSAAGRSDCRVLDTSWSPIWVNWSSAPFALQTESTPASASQGLRVFANALPISVWKAVYLLLYLYFFGDRKMLIFIVAEILMLWTHLLTIEINIYKNSGISSQPLLTQLVHALLVVAHDSLQSLLKFYIKGKVHVFLSLPVLR